MSIPKQPRTRSSSSASTSRPKAAGVAQGKEAPESTRSIQDVYRTSAEGVQSAYLDAQKECLSAYLAYLEILQKVAQANQDATMEYLNEVARTQGNVHAATEAHSKFVLGNIDRQASSQKAVIDAATAYSQSLQECYSRLEESLGQQNQVVAEALKNELLKIDVRTGDLPSLSLLYQTLRTMSAEPQRAGTAPA